MKTLVFSMLLSLSASAQVLQMDGIIPLADLSQEECHYRASLFAALTAEDNSMVIHLRRDHIPLVILKVYDYSTVNVYNFNLVMWPANNGVAYSFRDFFRNGRPVHINSVAQDLIAYYTRQMKDHLLYPIKPVSSGN